MIIQRVTWNVKRDCMEKVIEVTKAEYAAWDKPPKTRGYTPNASQNDTFAFEFEFENLAEYEKFWEAWFERKETAEFNKKINKLTERGGTSEIWNLVEY
jgi:hypothetical protein